LHDLVLRRCRRQQRRCDSVPDPLRL
jgi:hypothetical protein